MAPTLAETIGCAVLPVLVFAFILARAIRRDIRHDKEVEKRIERWDV